MELVKDTRDRSDLQKEKGHKPLHELSSKAGLSVVSWFGVTQVIPSWWKWWLRDEDVSCWLMVVVVKG